MPTRLLRDGILSSRAVNLISEPAEILYRRLMSIVDDFGRAEADLDLIRARCFPLQLDRWPATRVGQFLSELGESPLVTVYHRGDKSYLQIENFGQRLQSKERFPAPFPEESATRAGSNSITVADFKELRRVTENHRESPLNTESESESYTKSHTQSVSGGSSLPALKTQTEWPLTTAELVAHDPAVDQAFVFRLVHTTAQFLISAGDMEPFDDEDLANAIRESHKAYKGKRGHGSGLLLSRVPQIIRNWGKNGTEKQA